MNWPRKGLMKSLLMKLLVFPLLWAKKSSGVTWDRSTWTDGRPVKVAASLRRWWVNLCQVQQKCFKAMRRSKLKVAVGLLTGHTNLWAHTFKLGLTAAGLPTAGMRKKKRCILYVIVWHWHVKDTEPESCVLEAEGSIHLEVEWPHWSSS